MHMGAWPLLSQHSQSLLIGPAHPNHLQQGLLLWQCLYRVNCQTNDYGAGPNSMTYGSTSCDYLGNVAHAAASDVSAVKKGLWSQNASLAYIAVFIIMHRELFHGQVCSVQDGIAWSKQNTEVNYCLAYICSMDDCFDSVSHRPESLGIHSGGGHPICERRCAFRLLAGFLMKELNSHHSTMLPA